MSYDAAIRSALNEAGISSEIVSARPLSGGCIHEVQHLTLDDGRCVVAKVNIAAHANLFHEEAQGLEALADTNTVLVPKPLGVSAAQGRAVILMEALESMDARVETWERFGEELASLHNALPQSEGAEDRYGFHINNHLGTTPQPNTWCRDWAEFNAEHRLGHQIRLASSEGLLNSDEVRAVELVITRLDQLIPRHPKPALLHGDLWSGNALPARHVGEARIAVIDPAPYFGDGWADIAMMRLFGGFPRACLTRYSQCVSDRDDVEPRIAVYQLYHVLNHVNIFGRGYVAQAMKIARSLN